MAYSSGSRRGGTRGGSRGAARGSRGGYGGNGRGGTRTRYGGRNPPPRSSGGPNATALGVGAILLVGVIAVIVIASGGKKKRRVMEPEPEVTGDTRVSRSVDVPREPEQPPPDISPEIIQIAKEIVAWMGAEEALAKAAHEAAMEAKHRGDDETWQAKLAEAREHLLNIRERWNNEVVAEIDGELPTGCKYDADQVANYHVGREAGKVTKALEFLSAISKQLRR